MPRYRLRASITLFGNLDTGTANRTRICASSGGSGGGSRTHSQSTTTRGLAGAVSQRRAPRAVSRPGEVEKPTAVTRPWVVPRPFHGRLARARKAATPPPASNPLWVRRPTSQPVPFGEGRLLSKARGGGAVQCNSVSQSDTTLKTEGRTLTGGGSTRGHGR